MFKATFTVSKFSAVVYSLHKLTKKERANQLAELKRHAAAVTKKAGR